VAGSNEIVKLRQCTSLSNTIYAQVGSGGVAFVTVFQFECRFDTSEGPYADALPAVLVPLVGAMTLWVGLVAVEHEAACGRVDIVAVIESETQRCEAISDDIEARSCLGVHLPSCPHPVTRHTRQDSQKNELRFSTCLA
jgi:hypothetical protein